jgi:hypothetical protein
MRSLFRAVLLVATFAVAARAGDLPGAGSHTSAATGDSHAWAVLASRSGSVAIQHFPPRGVDALGRRGAEDGTVRLAATLAQMPEALAAIDNRLYIVFQPSVVAEGSSRQVLYLDAERGSVDGSWVGEAGGGRLPSLPSLPGDRNLLGFAGSPAGPVALMAGQARGDQGRGDQLLVLKGSTWVQWPLPSEWAESRRDGSIRVVALADGIALVSLRTGKHGAWIKTTDTKGPDRAIALQQADWEWRALQFPEETGTQVGGVFSIRGRFIVERRVDSDVEVWEADRARLLATLKGVPRGYSSAPLDQTGRLMLSWRTPPDPAGTKATPSPEKLRIAEISVLTGQVLYDGDVQTQPPFSKFELKILAAFLVSVMLAIVVFVLRSDKAGEPLTLPKGVSLAEPGRRFMAAVLDAGLAFLIATKLTGIGAGEVLTVRAITGQVDALTLYLATVGVGLVLSCITEGLFGRSVGKALTGMEVVRPVVKKLPDGAIEPGLARATLIGVIIRNIVKWVLPPVAMSGLSSPEHRHRGDTAGRTVVIVRDKA